MSKAKYIPPPGPSSYETDLFLIGDRLEEIVDTYGAPAADGTARAAILLIEQITRHLRGDLIAAPAQEPAQPVVSTFARDHFDALEQKASLALTSAKLALNVARGHNKRMDDFARDQATRDTQVRDLMAGFAAASADWSTLPAAAVVIQKMIDDCHKAVSAAEKFTKVRMRVRDLEQTIAARDRARGAARSRGQRVRAAALTHAFSSGEIDVLITALREAQRQMKTDERVAA